MFQNGDLSRLLAYPRDFLEPFGEGAQRDDALVLLPRLRMLWDMMDDSTNSGVERISKAIAGSLHGEVKLVSLIRSSITEDESKCHPVCRLVAPNTVSIHYSLMDSHQTEQERKHTFSVRGSSNQTILNWPLGMLPKPLILMNFDMNKFKIVDGVKRNAQVEIRAFEMEDQKDRIGIKITIMSFNGCKKEFTVSPNNNSFHSTMFSKDEIVVNRELCLLPKTPTQITFDIQRRFAEFWNSELRASPLVIACQPADSASNRTLCFANVSLTTSGDKPGMNRAVLRGSLHESAASCICALHNMQPIHKRFPGHTFTGSNVTMSISMCGKKLQKEAPGVPHATCPLHHSATPIVPGVPDICCHGTYCEVSCGHFTSNKQFKPGAHIRSIPLDDVNLLHAQLLLASSIRCSSSLTPMLGKRKPEEIALECDSHSGRLNHQLETIKRMKLCRPVKYTDEELSEMDKTTTALLRSGKAGQHYVKSKQHTVLVTRNTKTGGLSSLGAQYENLKQYHKWMFPRVERNED
jgi:hypothetical protein